MRRRARRRKRSLGFERYSKDPWGLNVDRHIDKGYVRVQGFVFYVNGDHSIPNTVKEEGEEKTIKVRSIEADFTRLMFEEE